MTLDLDELERHAQDAASHGEVELYRSITPQSVLALIERVRELDGRLSKMCDLHMEEKRKRMDYQERVKDLTS